MPHVYLLAWCQRPELLYGSTLTFNTLRTGFPHAPIHIADAASIPSVRPEIEHLAKSCDAEFLQFPGRVQLYEFIERVLVMQKSGPAVFVDPDMCFWESIEHWEFDGLAAGRYIPRHHCDFNDCVTEQRLHTSLLWIPDVARLRDAIAKFKQRYRFFEPFRKLMVPTDSGWRFFDTACGLYAAFPEQMCHFTERQLDAYDHLFSGSFGDSVFKKLGPDFAPAFQKVHVQSQDDYRQLKGAWRMQEAYFKARAVPARS